MDSQEVIVGNRSLTKISSSYIFLLIHEKWTISCHVSKQGCHSHQRLQLLYEPLSPKGTQKGEAYLPSARHQTTATPYGEPQGSSGYEKCRVLAPES